MSLRTQDPPSPYSSLHQQQYHHQHHNLQQQQQQQQQQQVQDLQQQRQLSRAWPRPQQDVCRAISLRLKRADSTADVLRVIAEHGQRFNEINTPLAFAQLARQLRFDSSSGRAAALQHASYAQLLQLAELQAPLLNPTKLAMVLTSMAWISSSNCDGEPAEQQPAAAHSSAGTEQLRWQMHQRQQQQQEGSVQQQFNSSGNSSDAAVQPGPSGPLLQLLARRLQQQLDAAEPEEVCHCLWAVAKLGQLDTPAASELLDAATAHSLSVGWLHLLTAKPLSSLLWVHAQLQLQQQQQQQQQEQQQQHEEQQQQQQHLVALLQAVMIELSQPGFLATWTPQELSMLLWSCAVFKLHIGWQQQQQQQGQQQQMLGSNPSTPQQQQQQALPPLPASVVEEVCRLAVQQVVRFTPQGIANTCLALVKLLEPPGSHHRQQQQQQQRQRQLEPQQLLVSAQSPAQHSAWAQRPVAAAAVGSQPPLVAPGVGRAVQQLFDVFTAAAAVQLHYYKPQEVANLWSACARLQQHLQQRQQYGALGTAVGQYAVNHGHQLSARDVFEVLVGFAQLRPPLAEPQVMHALLHRLGQVSEQLQPYEQAATAWSLVRLAEMQQQQAGSTTHPLQQLRCRCLAAARELLDSLAQQLAAASAEPVAAAAAGTAPLQQLLGNAMGSRPLVLLLWAVAGSGYMSEQLQHVTSLSLEQQQQQLKRQHLLAALLQQVQQQVGTCSCATLVQLLVTLTRMQPVLAYHHCLLHVCKAAEARLQPMLPHLPTQQVVLAAWALLKLPAPPGSADPPVSTAAAAAAAVDVRPDMGASAASSSSQGSTAAGFLLASLAELQQRQQLATLAGDAAAALLWCCSAARVVPSPAALQPLLAAAEQRLPQMAVRELTMLLQALARLQQQQQQQQQSAPWAQQQEEAAVRLQTRLISQAAARLQLHLQHFLLHSDSSSSRSSGREAGTAGRSRKGSRADSYSHSSTSVQYQKSLGSETLLSIAASCMRLPQLQGSDLLLAVVEVWQQQVEQQQLQQQQGSVQQVQQALAMLWMLSGSSSSSAAGGSMAAQLQDLLQLSVSQLQQCLAQQQQSQLTHGHTHTIVSAEVVVLAARVFARLRYQPPPALLHLMNRQLQHGLALLSSRDLVLVLHAFVQLGLPAQGLAAAVAAGLQCREQASRAAAATAQKAAAHKAGRRSTPLAYKTQVLLLWSLLAAFYTAGREQGLVRRLMVQLAASVLVMTKQLEDHPQLLQLVMQCRELLQTPRYKMVATALCSKLAGHNVALCSRAVLVRRFAVLSGLLLSRLEASGPRPDGPDRPAGGFSRRLMSSQGLVQVLRSSQQERLRLLQQRIVASCAAISQQQQQQQQEVLWRLAPLLRMWMQLQLQRTGLKALAVQLAAAGMAAERMRLVGTANGDLALLLSAADSDGGSSSSRSGAAGVAVVLESSGHRAGNTGRPLGPSLCMYHGLESKGYGVFSMQLDMWLPGWVSEALGRRASVPQGGVGTVDGRRRAMLQQLLDQCA